MKKNLVSVLTFAFILLLASCSSTPEPKKQTRHYSENTLDFFNKIETTNSRIREVQIEQKTNNNVRNDDLNSFEKIENVRIDSLPSSSSGQSYDRPYHHSNEAPARNESYRPRQEIPSTKTMSENERQQKTNNQLFDTTSNESLVEIEQHVSYYCMNKKNVARFKNSPELCQRYTNAVLAKCIPNKKVANRNNVACVLKYLKR